MKRTIAIAAMALAALILLDRTGAQAQSKPVYMPMGPAKAALYTPDNGPAPHVGLLVMHRVSNYLAHPACTEMSARGFLVLCMNSRFDNNEVRVVWEEIALDVKAGVEFLGAQPGITKVVLFGHSGGAPTMAFYEAVAENGVAFCKDAKRLTKCTDELANLPRADAVVFADAHPGFPMTILRGFNGAVTDEEKLTIDPKLDPFSEANGYNPNGQTRYSPEFRTRYFRAQSDRMNKIIDVALAKQTRMAKGEGRFPDNDIVIIAMGGNPTGGPGGAASLHTLDTSIPEIMSTSRPQPFRKNDGSIETKVAASVARPDTQQKKTNRTFDAGAKVYSITSFLSANAVRSTNSLDGVDHCSSNNSTVCAVRSIDVPQLFMAMGAANFIRDNEMTFDASKAKDKEYVVIEGALHGFGPCIPCEPTKGAFSNSRKNVFDHAAAWINKRF